jgi:hypothetical protein
VFWKYRRAHCCNDVANIAHVRLITKLKNKSEFTQMAYAGGENAGGLTKVEGVDGRDTLGSA